MLFVVLSCFLQLITSGYAATLPSGFSEVAITGIDVPTAMAIAPDGRLFVCQQNGVLRVIKNGLLLPTPFVTVQTDNQVERGLVGVAVDPSNTFVYVFYTVPGAGASPARNRISRFAQNGDVAAGSEVILKEFEPLSGAIHNGGAMAFGPDGMLYVALGETGVPTHAQSLENRLGKILRFDPNLPPTYIPSDNPFSNTPAVTGENKAIWAYGLRNPFTFAFQPGTGRMFINDVGRDAYEEINEGVAGANYGWPTTEGPTTDPSFKPPLYAYGRTGDISGCAITGGAFYNPTSANFPSQYTGKYFFSDYCSDWIRTLNATTGQVDLQPFATGAGAPVYLIVGPTGSLYYLSRDLKAVVKIDYTGNQPATVSEHPQSITVAENEPAAFEVTTAGAPPITYQWQRNQADIPGQTGNRLSLSSVSLADSGAQFRVRVSNDFGGQFSNSATLTVTPGGGNRPPQGTITAPAGTTLYSGGQTISYSGTATDPEDGTIPAANFCWLVNFHHDAHNHPFLPETCGSTSGNVTIPTIGETSPNVWYRFHLTVRDSGGRTHTSFVDIQPRKANLTLQSNPPGMQLTLDGQPVVAPLTVTSVVGIMRSLGAPTTLGTFGTRWVFTSWSDNGTQSHDINTPATNTTYTASFLTQHLLTLSASGPGSISANPPSVDGFYNAGTTVEVTASPSSQFQYWSGDLGTDNPANLTMTNPRTVTAHFLGGPQTCTFSLLDTATTAPSTGDLRRLEIETNPGCTWEASSALDWLRIVLGTSGSGPGSVRLEIAANPGNTPRTGSVTIAGIRYDVTQLAANCTVDLSGADSNPSGTFGSYELRVATGPTCQWEAEAFPLLPTFTGATTGTGSGVLRFTLPQNIAQPRPAYISVGGQFWHFLQKSLTPTLRFSDVPASHPFFDSIGLLQSREVSPGCGGTRYCPEEDMLRSEMAAFLVRVLFGETFLYSSTPYFTDVPATHPYFRYVQKLRETGITAGCTTTTFCPADTVTRGQMAAFLVRARLGITDADRFPVQPAPLFADVPPNDPFFAYIQKLKELGITTGCTPDRFCPGDETTRGQMAVFIARAFLVP
ncbi:MAG: PQQ-dependent sugar dehydrogenase [Bryobacterales bacterium]|nr:PQQ-dependent sugar dehydrogenase [Bryobacterales bacterium]